MILGQEDKPPLDDDTLEHFGVKGMKWGVHRKSATVADQLHKNLRAREKINKDKALAGYGYRGWNATKSRAGKKLAKSGATLSKDERAAFDKKNIRNTQVRLAKRGLIDAGVVLGGGLLLVNAMSSPRHLAGNRAAVAMLAGGVVGKQAVSQIHAVRTSAKLDKLFVQRDALQKQLGSASKK